MKPKSLKIGDKLAIISPSGASGAYFPHRVEKGLKALEDLGFKPILFSSVRKSVKGSAGLPEDRAIDLHKAFLDPSISGIIAAIGGLTLNEVLPLIDFNIIKSNPKIFCGYSDNTLLHFALNTQANLISFYGPSLITQFGEHPYPFEYTIKYFLKAVMSNEPIGTIDPSVFWTDEFLDWHEKKDLVRARKLKDNYDGHIWLKKGKAKGKSFIACLPSIISLHGTKFFPDLENSILFLENPEGQELGKGQPLSYINSDLATLKLMGIFERISGLIVGRLYGGKKSEDYDEFFNIILRQTKEYDFPILANVNFGHSDPIITIPYNVLVELDSEKNLLSIQESGTI